LNFATLATEMAKTFEAFNRQRLRSSYVSVVISISLVLFLLGLLGLLVINAEALGREVRENFTFMILLDDNAREADLRAFQKELELEAFVKKSTFITSEEGAAILQEELGENFLDFLGVNPIPNAIEIQLKADFVVQEELEKIEEVLNASSFVTEVVYDRDLLQIVNANIQRISVAIGLMVALLLLISIALINSSIRLAIYSRRFIIKTMQLVGATKGFIQKPFLAQSLKIGFLGACLAAAFLFGGSYYLYRYYPDWGFLMEPTHLIAVMGGIILLGIIISWLCTFFAVRKYLNLKTDELY
jgi:cell division transport system permease protein